MKATSFFLAKTKTHWFLIISILILVVAIYFRFVNYENRWGLAYDQAHDALVAIHSLDSLKIPLVGPFSSAGPFQTPGNWYWFIAGAYAISPHTVISPWIMITLLSVAYVAALIYIGRNIVDWKFGILLGILATVSTAQVTQSTNLTVVAPLAFASLLSLWAMTRYIRKKTPENLFLLGFCVALAPSFHLQGISLGLLIIFTFVFTGLPTLRGFVYLLLGGVIPMLSLILFDIGNNFTNIRNMIYYFLVDQHNISLDVLGRRWLTYLGVFWPNAWALIIGGNSVLSFVIIGGIGVLTLWETIKQKLPKEWMILVTTFCAIVILLRYVHTPLFDSYLVMQHTFIFFLTARLLHFLFKKQVIVGTVSLLILVLGSIIQSQHHITIATNTTATTIEHWKRVLTSTYPNDRFVVYDRDYLSTEKSLPLSLYLAIDDKIADNGKVVGVRTATSEVELLTPVIFRDPSGYDLLDLSSHTVEELKKEKWVLVNPSEIYKTTEDWRTLKK